MATTILLVRHGETDWNRDRRFQGHADVPLNATGRAQAADLAASLDGEPFAAVYTSPLRRAAETAAVLAARLGLQPRSHEGLREVDVGSWTGLSVEEVEARFPAGYARWRADRQAAWDDGETFEELAERVGATLIRIAGDHPGEHLLVVTHGGAIRVVVGAALGLRPHELEGRLPYLGNCATNRIVVQDGNLEAVD